MAGFFGLEWTNNVTIEVLIEADGFNNSLAGAANCDNHHFRNNGGSEASEQWKHIYLQNATARLKELVTGFDWDIEDTYAAQSLCPYETVRDC